MNTDKLEERRDRFKELLLKLALEQGTLSSEEERNFVYRELESIYHDDEKDEGFRHYYSDIFSVITIIDKNPQLGNIEILNQNIDMIQKDYSPLSSSCDIRDSINKLYDHINLDIARMNYFKETQMRSQSELQKVNAALESVEEKINEMESAVDKADEMQRQYITILGIFASIVLAFTGGIAFSTSVLENISEVSIYRIIIIAVGLAFVLMNIIYILTRFVLEITKKKGDKIKYPCFMVALNVTCLVCVIVIIVCWFFDIEHAAEIFQNWLY